MRLFIGILNLSLLACQLLAQPATPLEVTQKKSVYVNEAQQFVVSLKNASEKAIIGYVVKFTRLGIDGAELDSIGLGGLSYDIASERKKPGDTWELMVSAATTNVPREIASDVKVDIDFVLFADGMATGPDILGRGMMLRGELDGVLGERARLRSILRKDGVEKLVQVLEAPEWERGRAK